MLKILKITIIVIVLMVGPSSCENCPDVPGYFSVTGLNFNNYKVVQGTPAQHILLNENASVNWLDYLMSVTFDMTYFAVDKISSGSKLYADCYEKGGLGSKVGVDTIYTITLNDYNDQFTKNDTINDIILIQRNYNTGFLHQAIMSKKTRKQLKKDIFFSN